MSVKAKENKMRQLDRYTGAAMIALTVLNCLPAKVYVNYGPSCLAANVQTKEKTKTKPQSKAKSDPKVKKNQATARKENENANWWVQSKAAAKLIHEGKYAQAESILKDILPLAREDAPNSLELGISLLRYGIALFAQQKFAQAIPCLNEAIGIISKKPSNLRQQRAMFQGLSAMAAALSKIHKFSQAEPVARRAIAYGIAFPGCAPPADMNKSYVLLRAILENENKIDEVNIMTDIINYIH